MPVVCHTEGVGQTRAKPLLNIDYHFFKIFLQAAFRASFKKVTITGRTEQCI